ncbi:hypothetical protein BBOV_III000750 [Babesia bovis T2Bo]|uniref:hypothetical protein n=1 Tax=Babesia bovis T2Bo TaxID=484906 RepID=UPI001C350E98|nr:hypothetical protein BBOV_III000750 [Babesia bovis T2Bo]EDO07642.2 hypothetical protein BBOV_III000750 [Babesia bovis T2Bo]
MNNGMESIYEFTYRYNLKLFTFGTVDGSDASLDDVATFLGHFNEKISYLLRNEAALDTIDETTCHIISTFICRVFPPYSPFIVYNNGLSTSETRILLDDVTKNLLNLICRIKDSVAAYVLGLDNAKFALNIFNLYWRNNKAVVDQLFNLLINQHANYVDDLVILVGILTKHIQREYEYINLLMSGIRQGRWTNNFRTSEISAYIAYRSDTSSSFDRNALFVDQNIMILDVLAYLETILQHFPISECDRILSVTVSSFDGESQISTLLTNVYYLFSQVEKLIYDKKRAIYKMELSEKLAATFQRSLFYRCKMIALNCLLSIVKYNVVIHPTESADYCYNWLLIFLEIGGEEYDVDSSVILEDLHDIDLFKHVDTWSSISGTWLPGEIDQLRSLVGSRENQNQTSPNDETKMISEVTGIHDTVVINNCLKKHNFDVSETILALLKESEIESRPSQHHRIQPHKKPTPSMDISTHFISKETRQSVLNYWDFINRQEIYDDDYDDDSMEDDVLPLNARLVYEEMTDSEEDVDDSSENVNQSGDNSTASKTQSSVNLPTEGHPSRSFHNSRKKKHTPKYNRKRNTINIDAFS